MSDPYAVTNWYWSVAGNNTQVYSSASNTIVPVADATYQAWVARGNHTIVMASLQDIADVMSIAELPLPPTTTTSDDIKSKAFDAMPRFLKAWAFDADNRIRVLEGQPTRTAAQFRNYVKGLVN